MAPNSFLAPRAAGADVMPLGTDLLPFYCAKAMQTIRGRNNSGTNDLICHQSTIPSSKWNSAMSDRINESSERIDGATSRSICRGVGERLRQDLRHENSELPSHLRYLMDELERQDRHN